MTTGEHGVLTRIVKPCECAIAFGIPTSEEAFRRDVSRPDKDFARHFGGLWSRYNFEFVSVLRGIEPAMRRLRVPIVQNLDRGHFQALTRSASVVILFSHWCDQGIEFADGLCSVSVVAETVAPEFEGILDLCVCRSTELAAAVRSKRRCIVRHTVDVVDPASSVTPIPSEVTPEYWLYFFMMLFKHLDQVDTSYPSAFEHVMNLFLKELVRRQ